jgi:hypothetical protein
LARKRSAASTRERLMPHWSRIRITTLRHSSRRIKPLSTRTAWKRSPIALERRSAATEESTPPETAPSTMPVGPTCEQRSNCERIY